MCKTYFLYSYVEGFNRTTWCTVVGCGTPVNQSFANEYASDDDIAHC